jgi:hypothetical protein
MVEEMRGLYVKRRGIGGSEKGSKEKGIIGPCMYKSILVQYYETI